MESIVEPSAARPRFSLGFYLSAVTRIMGSPREFFANFGPVSGWGYSLPFLLLSSAIFTGARLMGTVDRPLLWAAILMVNAVGMVFLASAAGYLTLVMTAGRTVGYGRFFGVYAYATGVALLASWVPFFLFIAEPWKWWMIGVGMTRGLGLRPFRAFLVILLSVAVLVLFFVSLRPMLPR